MVTMIIIFFKSTESMNLEGVKLKGVDKKLQLYGLLPSFWNSHFGDAGNSVRSSRRWVRKIDRGGLEATRWHPLFYRVSFASVDLHHPKVQIWEPFITTERTFCDSSSWLGTKLLSQLPQTPPWHYLASAQSTPCTWPLRSAWPTRCPAGWW